MSGPQKYLPISLDKLQALTKDRKKIYFHEIMKALNVSAKQLDDFLIPLLGEGAIDGAIDLRCPDCGAELGVL